jgi:hypothetical protein
MKYSLRSLMIVFAISGPVIWYAWSPFSGHREAQAAANVADMRWQELQSAQSAAKKTPTVKNLVGERHARLRYKRDWDIAAEKTRWCLVPVSLPPAPSSPPQSYNSFLAGLRSMPASQARAPNPSKP